MRGMENLNRRDMFLGLTSLTALMTAGVAAADGQSGDQPVLAQSRSFAFDALPVKKSANGGASREVIHGFLATGEYVAMHQTLLPPGQMPHPPHKHRNSEFICIREGTVEYYHDDKTERVGPGGVIFNASNQMHGMKNVGTVDAQYFVIEIGRTTDAVPVSG